MSFTLTTIRAMLRRNRHIADESFNDATIDDGIKWACNWWMRETKCDRTALSVSIVANDTSKDFTSGNTGFLPGRIIGRLYISASNHPLKIVPVSTILTRRRDGSVTGKPTLLSMDLATAVQLYPTSDGSYTITGTYWKPLVSFTSGTGSDSSTTINIDESYMGDVVLGAAAFILADYPGHRANEMKQDFMTAMARAKSEIEARPIYVNEPGSENDIDYGIPEVIL